MKRFIIFKLNAIFISMFDRTRHAFRGRYSYALGLGCHLPPSKWMEYR